MGRHAMEAADTRKTVGIIIMLTTVPDLIEVKGVKAEPETGQRRPTRNAGIVAERTTKRVSAGRSAPIPTNPDLDPAEPNKEIDNGHTTTRAPKELEMDRAHPS